MEQEEEVTVAEYAMHCYWQMEQACEPRQDSPHPTRLPLYEAVPHLKRAMPRGQDVRLPNRRRRLPALRKSSSRLETSGVVNTGTFIFARDMPSASRVQGCLENMLVQTTQDIC